MSKIKDAVYLIDDLSFYIWGALRPVWDYCGDGEGTENAIRFNQRETYLGDIQGEYFLLNSDRDGEVYVRRDSNPCECELLTFEMLLDNRSGDGLYLAFGSRTEAFLRLETKGEALFIGDHNVCSFSYGQHFIKLGMNMETSQTQVYLDGKDCGSFGFNRPAFPYSCLKIGYGMQGYGAAALYFVKLYTNYLVNDMCLNRYEGSLPDEYRVTVSEGSSVRSVRRVTDRQTECYLEGRREYTYLSQNREGAKNIIERAFCRAKGKIVLQVLYLMKDSQGKLEISLCDQGETVISVFDEGTEVYSSNGSSLRVHHQNVWQTLRIYADTDTNQADIWLNGKRTKTVPFDAMADGIDCMQITYEAVKDSSLMFSDILVWVQPEEPEDYVPQPVIPQKKGDYVVGINVCSLWREGHHFGWDVISPYDDLKPVLGFYDEGLPETADWEIKYMAEHGIDYQLYCWFSTEGKAPIRTSHNHSAWVNGHFYAKYSDKVKFALLWEAASGGEHAAVSPQSFREILVPYWLDYFFSDDRYMRVDNKAVMSIFGPGFAEAELGGAQGLREALQYLREEVKKLGYDDLIIMGCHFDMERYKDIGFDAYHAYHWYKKGGERSSSLQINIENNEKRIAEGLMHVVPTVSVGFKDIAWGGMRVENLPCREMYEAMDYCIQKVLPNFEEGTWKSKMLHLSTWNEYGEGTYIMPSELNGFGYLDAVRKAICKEEPHEDVVPTTEQKRRIGYLYPEKRYRLKRTKYDVKPMPKQERIVAQYTFCTKEDMDKWTCSGMEEMEIRDGVLYGTAKESLPEMELKDTLDASEIAYVKVICSNKHTGHGQGTEAEILISNTSGKKDYYRGEHNAYRFGCSSEERKTFTIQLNNKSVWAGTIYGFQFIPVHKGSFEVESITFYAADPHVSIYNPEGREIFFGDYLQEIGGELYVPLDPSDDVRQYDPEFFYGNGQPRRPSNGVYSAIGYHYEWYKEESRLEIWNDRNHVDIVVGRPYAVKNEESYTLIRPAFLKDGIPTIAFRDMVELFEITYEKIGSKIYLKSNKQPGA